MPVLLCVVDKSVWSCTSSSTVSTPRLKQLRDLISTTKTPKSEEKKMRRPSLKTLPSLRLLHTSSILRGALTSKPYAFVARPWELDSIDAIDNMNALGANIQLQIRGNEILRILPRTNDDINEEWIDDKTRFSYDGLKAQRLIKPLCRDVENPNVWSRDTHEWRDVFERIKVAVGSMKGSNAGLKMRGLVGPTTDLYSVLAMTDLAEMLTEETEKSSVVETVGSQAALTADLPLNYRFNTTIAGIEKADLCLLVGTNLMIDSPLLVSRMRKGFLRDRLKISQLGFRNELSFPADQIGLSPSTLREILQGNHPFAKELQAAERPMIVLDASIFDRADGKEIASVVEQLAANPAFKLRQYGENEQLAWNGINFFHRNANDVGLLDLGRTMPFCSESEDKTDLLFLMHVQGEDLPNGSADVASLRRSAKFIVYQGSHGDELASIADIVLPSAAFTEKTGIYTNLEGRAQQSRHAILPPGYGRNDWEIIRALSEVLGVTLPYSSTSEIHDRLETLVPNVGKYTDAFNQNLNSVIAADFVVEGYPQVAMELAKDSEDKTLVEPLKPVHFDFHLQGHPIARASRTMAQCSQEYLTDDGNFIQM